MAYGLKRLLEGESRPGVSLRESRARLTAKMYDMIMSGEAPVSAFSVREAWESLVGPIGDTLDMSVSRDRILLSEGRFRESELQTGMFVILAGAVLQRAIIDEFELLKMVGDMLCDPLDSNLPVETLSGTQAIDEPRELEEGEEFPWAGYGEKAVQPPGPKKKGEMIGITAEVITHDQTGKVMDRARDISKVFAYDRERMILNSIADLTGYKRYYPIIDGVPTQTDLYRTSATSNNWYNRNVTQKASNPLTIDPACIDAAMQVFAARTDEKDRRITVIPKVLLCPMAKRTTAVHLKNGTGFATQPSLGSTAMSISGPSQLKEIVGGDFQVVSSAILDGHPSTGTTDWYFGDPKSCFKEHRIWPITVDRSLEGDFRRDIPVVFRAKRKSALIVKTDAYWLKNAA